MNSKECAEVLEDLLISVKNENIGRSPESKHIREVNREEALAQAIQVIEEMEKFKHHSPMLLHIMAKVKLI